MRALPGVDAAAIVNSPPIGGYSIGASVTLDNRRPEPGQGIGAPVIVATPEYLRVLGIRRLRGRALDDRDRAGSADVALVSEFFANSAFHGADPIGRSIFWMGNQSTIVGVIADVRHSGPERPASPEIVVSEWQHPQLVSNLLVRTRNDPMALASSVRPVIWAIDKDLPVSNPSTMSDRLARSGSSRRVQTVLLTSFGLLALLLSAVGIYGVGAEAVAQRTREIGLRMALGARAADVVRSVMRRSLALSAAGIAMGAGAGSFLVRYLKTLLYGVKPTTPSPLPARCWCCSPWRPWPHLFPHGAPRA